MRATIVLLAVGGMILVVATKPAIAHHSFAAEFDVTKPMKLTGKVTTIEWTNPHAYLFVDVEDAQTGTVTNWAIEMGSPNGLRRLGWTRTVVKAGDIVTVEGFLGRYKSNLANAGSVVLASTGQKLGAASTEGVR